MMFLAKNCLTTLYQINLFIICIVLLELLLFCSNFQHYVFEELTQAYFRTLNMVPLYFEVATPVMPYTLLVQPIYVLNSTIK